MKTILFKKRITSILNCLQISRKSILINIRNKGFPVYGGSPQEWVHGLDQFRRH